MTAFKRIALVDSDAYFVDNIDEAFELLKRSSALLAASLPGGFGRNTQIAECHSRSLNWYACQQQGLSALSLTASRAISMEG